MNEENYLKDKDTAIVFNIEEGYTFRFPKMESDEHFPAEIAVLTAIFAKLKDPDFIQKMLDYYQEVLRVRSRMQ